jgi:hypothetical protein
MALEHELRRRERPVSSAADEQPALAQGRSITAAIAWPKPMHMQAIP